MKAQSKSVKMPALQAALDKESFEWLEINYPNLLAALEAEIGNGAEPDQVYRYVLAYFGREEIARRLQQAARNMQRAAGA